MSHAVQTSEIAVSPSGLRAALFPALLRGNISFVRNAKIRSVERRDSGMMIRYIDTYEKEHSLQADLAVNCLWHGRIAVDKTLGIHTSKQSIYRLKYGLLGQDGGRKSRLTSTTFVLGAFGDLVRYKGGEIYASWYPECMTDLTRDEEIPDAWTARMSGKEPWSSHKSMVGASTAALGQLHGDVSSATFHTAVPGVIVAWGTSDIDDPESELHSRSNIGLNSCGDYFSIDTGKFTMAPYFANQLIEELRAQ